MKKHEKLPEMAQELSIEELESVTGGALLRPIKLPPGILKPIYKPPINPDIFA